jgi:threonine dehydrogenase-like Zn-dependent dehydrogenase
VKQVIVVDRIDERLAMAQRSGADWVFNNGAVAAGRAGRKRHQTDVNH